MVDLRTVDLSILRLLVETIELNSLISMLNWSRRFFSLRLRDFLIQIRTLIIYWTMMKQQTTLNYEHKFTVVINKNFVIQTLHSSTTSRYHVTTYFNVRSGLLITFFNIYQSTVTNEKAYNLADQKQRMSRMKFKTTLK